MFNKSAVIAGGVALLVLGACSPKEEAVVVPQETPIYAKDGTIIGMRPMVGMSMDDGSEENIDNMGVDTSAGANMSDGMDMDMDMDMDDDDMDDMDG